jgi:DNA-binding FadR family transcriptional regulator
MSSTPPATPALDLQTVVFSPLAGGGLAEQTVRRLADAITIGLLRPGDRLPPEAELSAWLRIAPMTLREALAALREAGYIETSRGRTGGTFVTGRSVNQAASPPTVSAEDLKDLKDFRRAILSQAARRAAERATDEELAALVQHVAADADSPANSSSHLGHEAQFHIALARCSGSERLWRHQTTTEMEFNGFAMAGEPGLTATQIHEDLRDHQAIVRALTERDADAAFSIAAAHADRASDVLIALLTSASQATAAT